MPLNRCHSSRQPFLSLMPAADLRSFRYRVEHADGSWWADEIVPLYNQAGLEKFAFVLPVGEQVSPDDTPAKPEAGEQFVTKHFGSEQAAISWLTAPS